MKNTVRFVFLVTLGLVMVPAPLLAHYSESINDQDRPPNRMNSSFP